MHIAALFSNEFAGHDGTQVAPKGFLPLSQLVQDVELSQVKQSSFNVLQEVQRPFLL